MIIKNIAGTMAKQCAKCKHVYYGRDDIYFYFGEDTYRKDKLNIYCRICRGNPLNEVEFGSKRCPSCTLTKPFVEFPRERGRKHGIGGYCLVCKAGKVRAKRQKASSPLVICVECSHWFPMLEDLNDFFRLQIEKEENLDNVYLFSEERFWKWADVARISAAEKPSSVTGEIGTWDKPKQEPWRIVNSLGEPLDKLPSSIVT